MYVVHMCVCVCARVCVCLHFPLLVYVCATTVMVVVSGMRRRAISVVRDLWSSTGEVWRVIPCALARSCNALSRACARNINVIEWFVITLYRFW